MKRIIILVLCVIATISVAYSQEQSEEIIIVFEDQTTDPEPSLRGPVEIPLSCSFFPGLETLHLTFLSDLGPSTITVVSMSTCSVDNYVQNGAGLCVIPLSSFGLTIIDVLSGNGHHYRAVFIA